MAWIIKDWMGNFPFKKYIKTGTADRTFKTFDDAEDFLEKWLDDRYETDRGDYFILKVVKAKMKSEVK